MDKNKMDIFEDQNESPGLWILNLECVNMIRYHYVTCNKCKHYMRVVDVWTSRDTHEVSVTIGTGIKTGQI